MSQLEPKQLGVQMKPRGALPGQWNPGKRSSDLQTQLEKPKNYSKSNMEFRSWMLVQKGHGPLRAQDAFFGSLGLSLLVDIWFPQGPCVSGVDSSSLKLTSFSLWLKRSDAFISP